jgi:hypothetical protein
VSFPQQIRKEKRIQIKTTPKEIFWYVIDLDSKEARIVAVNRKTGQECETKPLFKGNSLPPEAPPRDAA